MGILFIGGIVGAVVLVVVLLAILAGGYVKASPSTALIISGIKKRPRILIGRGGARIPFFERMDKLFLGQISVDIKTETPVPTNDYINVNVDAVAKVMVGRDEESVQLAARNFLNFTGEQIAKDLQDSLEGNMREIIGTLTLEAINTDRDSFSDQVVNKAAQDMKKLGIEIISCNIQNVTDNNGLIVDLGADNTARIKKRAAISRAEAERDVAVAKAQAQKEANDARTLRLHRGRPILPSDRLSLSGRPISSARRRMRPTKFRRRSSRNPFRPLRSTRRSRRRSVSRS